MVRFHPDPPIMSQKGETFFTRVGCMDGRVQEPVATFGRKKFGGQYPDTIIEAGLVGLLAKETVDRNLLTSLKKKISISLEKHHSKGIVVYGHQDCAGNPVDDEKHKQDTKVAAQVISSFVPQDVRIAPVFVKRENDTWIVEEL